MGSCLIIPIVSISASSRRIAISLQMMQKTEKGRFYQEIALTATVGREATIPAWQGSGSSNVVVQSPTYQGTNLRFECEAYLHRKGSV
jgi:hypothetical protein